MPQSCHFIHKGTKARGKMTCPRSHCVIDHIVLPQIHGEALIPNVTVFGDCVIEIINEIVRGGALIQLNCYPYKKRKIAGTHTQESSHQQVSKSASQREGPQEKSNLLTR